MLGELDAARRVIVADLEAGLGTLSRAGSGLADVLLVLVEPSTKSREVGRLAVEMARERGFGRIIVVANRIRQEAEVGLIQEALPGEEIVTVPDDPAILDADRQAQAPIDTAPDAPGVRALAGLARRLLASGG